MKLKTERDLSYIEPLTVEFFQNNRTSSISVILLTNGWTDGQTDGRKDRQTVAILIPPWWRKEIDAEMDAMVFLECLINESLTI